MNKPTFKQYFKGMFFGFLAWPIAIISFFVFIAIMSFFIEWSYTGKMPISQSGIDKTITYFTTSDAEFQEQREKRNNDYWEERSEELNKMINRNNKGKKIDVRDLVKGKMVKD